MTGWADGPLAAFDTETTGPEPLEARIVTATIAVVNTTPAAPPHQWLADPGVEIPAEATAIHGITTEHAREHGAEIGSVVAQIRATLASVWRMGSPVVIYNASYDLTVLDRELVRCGMDPLDNIGPVIDPLVLDRAMDRFRRGKRTLTAACEHYKVRLDGAHDSTADAVAAARVAWRIAQKYPQVAEMTLPELMIYQEEAHADWAEGFSEYLARQGKSEVIDGSWPIRRPAVVSR